MAKFNENFFAGGEGAWEAPVEVDENERKEKELWEKIKFEQAEARERFLSLDEKVEERYGRFPEAVQEKYVTHNEQIRDFVIELAMHEGFPKEDLLVAEMAATWHDSTKGDEPPAGFQDVKYYALAMHAKTAADLVPEIFTDEYLKDINFEGEYGTARQEIARSIMEHMGPRPGFMDDILKYFNQEMEKRGSIGVDYPKAESKSGKVLLEADMMGLVSPEGIKKVFGDRMVIENFRREDEELAKKYNDEVSNLDFTSGEAAILSAFENFQSVREMDLGEYALGRIDELEEEAKKMEFSYGEEGKKISWQTASEKKRRYDEEMSRNKESEELAEV